MIRTQIQLPEVQVHALKQLAALQHTSMADIIRRAVELFTTLSENGAVAERKERALAVVGMFHSGCSDVSARHDEYLAESFK